MRSWFMVAALILGLIGIWGEQDRAGRTATRGGDGSVTTMDGPNPFPTPRVP